jgi:hypothetical protein
MITYGCHVQQQQQQSEERAAGASNKRRAEADVAGVDAAADVGQRGLSTPGKQQQVATGGAAAATGREQRKAAAGAKRAVLAVLGNSQSLSAAAAAADKAVKASQRAALPVGMLASATDAQRKMVQKLASGELVRIRCAKRCGMLLCLPDTAVLQHARCCSEGYALVVLLFLSPLRMRCRGLALTACSGSSRRRLGASQQQVAAALQLWSKTLITLSSC